jgi:prolyl-tRNA synthetase
MAHGDNRGLKLPPRVAPIQVVIVPIAQKKEGVLDKANELFVDLKKDYRVKLDDRDNYSTGYKFSDWEMRGVPLRLEIGPKDIENNQCVLVRRDTAEKIIVSLDEVNAKIAETLDAIHENMYKECEARLADRTTVAHTLEEFEQQINTKQGFIKAMFCGDNECEDKIKELTAAKSRCIPFDEEHIDDKCVVCGKPAKHMVVWGRQY